MDAALYFSLMNDIKPSGEKAGSLRKGVVSSVVPYATFGDVIDLMIWIADSDDAASSFQYHAARHSDLMPPSVGASSAGI